MSETIEQSASRGWLEVATLRNRLDAIKNIILAAENRAMACDGPVNKTINEMTDYDIRRIYELTIDAAIAKVQP